MTTRRVFVERAALAAVGLTVPFSEVIGRARRSVYSPPRGFLDLLRLPDRILVQTEAGDQALVHTSGERWTSDTGVVVTTTERDGALHVGLSSPAVGVKRVHLRWRGNLTATRLILGDAWERAYGDLEWRGWVSDRVMPWYFGTHDGSLTHAYGVRTGARAFCFWQVDPQGISLWTDVRSGGAGVQLGERTLDVCDVVCRAGRHGETAFGAVHAFCKQMCSNPRLPA